MYNILSRTNENNSCTFFAGLFNAVLLAQADYSAKILVNEFNLECEKLHKKIFYDDFKSTDKKVWENIKFYFSDINYKEVNALANLLKDMVYQSEKNNQFSESVSELTRQLICSIQEPYIIFLLERSINNDTKAMDAPTKTPNDMLKVKII